MTIINVIKKSAVIISILFLVWVIASFIDVSAHNLSAGTTDSFWNIFNVIWEFNI